MSCRDTKGLLWSTFLAGVGGDCHLRLTLVTRQMPVLNAELARRILFLQTLLVSVRVCVRACACAGSRVHRVGFQTGTPIPPETCMQIQ